MASRPLDQKPLRQADVYVPASQAPLLIVVIDCEEDFDWQRPLRGTHFNLESTSRLAPVQQLFAEFGIVPTYAVGYPIVEHDTAWRPLALLQQDGACEIGAHLHPWVTPPHLEVSNLHNSFPGNLPPDLERAKLEMLIEKIIQRFGASPTVYKAGRYGVGPATFATLRELGFRIDVSFMPHWSFDTDEGPNFLADSAAPFWLDDDQGLLEIPVTAGFTGLLRSYGRFLHPRIGTARLHALRVPALMARSRLLNRVRLTPEGIGIEEAKTLTRTLLGDGQRVFQLSFHSTSLVPGSTQYVRDEGDLSRFIAWLRTYLTFFRLELAGESATPHQILQLAGAQSLRHV